MLRYVRQGKQGILVGLILETVYRAVPIAVTTRKANLEYQED
jgi:hypothetical protein